MGTGEGRAGKGEEEEKVAGRAVGDLVGSGTVERGVS